MPIDRGRAARLATVLAGALALGADAARAADPVDSIGPAATHAPTPTERATTLLEQMAQATLEAVAVAQVEAATAGRTGTSVAALERFQETLTDLRGLYTMDAMLGHGGLDSGAVGESMAEMGRRARAVGASLERGPGFPRTLEIWRGRIQPAIQGLSSLKPTEGASPAPEAAQSATRPRRLAAATPAPRRAADGHEPSRRDLERQIKFERIYGDRP